MVRLSLVNLYLHGFTDPHIAEYDALTSQDKWNEHADVILANPPFMSPKGGIKPHNRFSVQSKRSEVLFVDYMAEHLTPGGRAGIIVPEGIIFQSQTAYTQLRRMLVEEYLVAVVSLPAGVFNPYSGVKTSILILDRSLAKQAPTIAFFKIENDGFGLGAQRREIEKNDLPQARVEIDKYLRRLRASESVADFQPALGLVVPKEKIAANGDYNLSGERYREGAPTTTAYPLVPVGRLMREGVNTIDPRKLPDEVFELWSIPAFDAGCPELVRGKGIGSQKKVVAPGDVLLSRIIPHIRRAWVVRANPEGRRQVASTEWIVFASDEVEPGFLRHVLVSDFFHASFMQTITGVGGSLSRANPSAVGEIRVPLPPLDVQKDIVAELDGYQKVIDGARAVLDNYRPHISIHPDWPMVGLEDACEINPETINPEIEYPDQTINYIDISSIENVTGRFMGYTEISSAEAPSRARRVVRPGDVLLSTVRPNLKAFTLLKDVRERALASTGFAVLRSRADRLHPMFLLTCIFADGAIDQMVGMMGRGAYPSINQSDVAAIRIPLPPLETQRDIVAEIEAEQALVNANRELIDRFESKIQDTLARVWGSDEPAPSEV
ncbi:MAG: N-6 DNA methylase, partial [Gemmatimonadaceae bacterium]|nr:N-6 DNA methylase [Gemmatimonadaceae bacterium]